METLQQIGLTKVESKIYRSLIRLGEAPIARIIKDTGAHPQVVYRAIDGLSKKGLILESIRGGKKHVRAENPDVLEDLAEKQLNDIRTLLPSLHALAHTTDDAIVRVIRGKDSVINMRMNALRQLKKGDTYYIIGGSGSNYFEAMGKDRVKWDQLRARKGIKKRLISFESQRKPVMEIDSVDSKLAEYRFLAGKHPIPSSTNIYRDSVAVIIWSKDPIVILIESKEVAASYKHHFDELWTIANK